MLDSKKEFILNYNISFLKISLVLLILLQTARIFLVLRFENWNEILIHSQDFITSLKVGLGNDFMIIFYIMILPTILFYMQFLLKSKYLVVSVEFFTKFTLAYFFINVLIVFLLLVVNYYYYSFYQTHFDILIFGFIHDDTNSILQSMWSDYPSLQILFVVAITGILLFILIKSILFKNICQYSKFKHFISLILIIFILVIGTIMYVPNLKNTKAAATSRFNFFYDVSLNGIVALSNALKEKKQLDKNNSKSNILEYNGYKDIGKALYEFNGDSTTHSLDFLIDTTQKNTYLEKSKPHVIFVLMESLNYDYFNFHSSVFNLLGKFEDYLDSSYIFKNFVSSTYNSSIYSLEHIVLGASFKSMPISQSSNFATQFSSSVARPYKLNGYSTNFIYGGDLNWRNLKHFLPNQYFENVVGSKEIKKTIPNAESGTWGVYDEYLFEYIYGILDSSDAPQFIFAFTTSNHTPYDLPNSYTPKSIDIPEKIERKLLFNSTIAKKHFTSFQYSCSKLGEFISNVRRNSNLSNTIIAITGDHCSHAGIRYTKNEMYKAVNIPFIVFLSGQHNKIRVDIDKFGSHKDIFPTLFNLSLSEAAYLKTGNDLFSDNNETFYYGVSYDNRKSLAFNKEGCVSVISSIPAYYTWDTYNQNVLTKSDDHLLLLKNKLFSHRTIFSLFLINSLE